MPTKGHNGLLPAGFHDVLPDLAARESRAITRLLECFTQFGYRQVKPPLAEFEDTLLSGSNDGLAEQTFRFIDPPSRRMMGLRADMTPQVARLAAQRLQDQPRPLRLSYAGQVLRVQGEGLHAERQLAQAGIELIGPESAAADAEVAGVALEALQCLGLKTITLDFGLPQLSGRIMAEHNIPPATRQKLLPLIEKKDCAAMEAAGDAASELLSALIAAAGPADKVLEALRRLRLPAAAGPEVERLETVIETLSGAQDVTLAIDPLERHGFEYHTGISFSLFAAATGEEIGRGGRYAIAGTHEPAAGFTLNVNAILRALPEKGATETVFVPFGASPQQSADLRRRGLATLHGLESVKDIRAQAKRLGCTHVFEQGKIVTA